ncbi:hypothetical protein GIB67_037387 [Kingdonia uniflora]|uniref:Uncharacterized protein n=1 Tax=Kingdonia uniflora TaxID=39325 RepID=A0A7J7M8H4_9MAGN|nr:hypothetical protein GIB67_037387 [Kingdonia uniflora]
MVKLAWFLPLLILLFTLPLIFSQSKSLQTQPQLLKSFKIKSPKVTSTCSYTVTIKTSCSSPSYTRDKVSLAFGDAYGNEVYAAKLDDPRSRTFERCSTDTFKISGPCMYKICYVYMLRRGSDGWKPESVKIYAPNSKAVSFTYNTFLPNGVWYGFKVCNGDLAISVS